MQQIKKLAVYDIEYYLNNTQLQQFYNFILADDELNKIVLSVNNYETDEVSIDELLTEIKNYMDSEGRILEYLHMFDKKVQDQFLNSIYNNFDFESQISFAQDNLIE